MKKQLFKTVFILLFIINFLLLSCTDNEQTSLTTSETETTTQITTTETTEESNTNTTEITTENVTTKEETTLITTTEETIPETPLEDDELKILNKLIEDYYIKAYNHDDLRVDFIDYITLVALETSMDDVTVDGEYYEEYHKLEGQLYVIHDFSYSNVYVLDFFIEYGFRDGEIISRPFISIDDVNEDTYTEMKISTENLLTQQKNDMDDLVASENIDDGIYEQQLFTIDCSSNQTAELIQNFDVFEEGPLLFTITYDEASLIDYYNPDEFLETIEIPSTIKDVPVTTIRGNAFGYNDLTTISIPETVTNIHYNALSKSEKLEEIIVHEDNEHFMSMDGVLYNNDQTILLYYPKNKSDTSFTVPASVIEIARNAFYSNNFLTQLDYETGTELEKIGHLAFLNTKIIDFHFPASLQTIGNNVFGKSNFIESITVDQDNAYFSSIDGVLYNKDQTVLLIYPQAKPDATFEIPAHVTELARGSFKFVNDLSSLTFQTGSQINELPEDLFYHARIETVEIPTSVETISTRTFSYTISLENIHVAEDNPYFKSVNGILYDKNLTTLYVFPANKTDTDYIVPASVIHIMDFAFEEADHLTSITFEAGSQLEVIGRFAFSDTRITSITIPASVRIIKHKALKVSSLTSIIFEEDSQLEIIGSSAFMFGKFTTIEIPASVKSIGAEAFYGASDLTTITFEEGSQLETIGESAFALTGITNITIPETVTTIEEHAFSRTPLTSIIIPISVEYMGYNVFSTCSEDLIVYVEAASKPNNWNDNWLGVDATVEWDYQE